MHCNRLLSKIKKLYIKRQKKPGETNEQTSACVRPEWVNKWPNSMVAARWWWWRWWRWKLDTFWKINLELRFGIHKNNLGCGNFKHYCGPKSVCTLLPTSCDAIWTVLQITLRMSYLRVAALILFSVINILYRIIGAHTAGISGY